MNSELASLLFDSIIDFPAACAFWRLYGDEIFISNELKQMIKVESNVLDPYEFVSKCQRMFGSFLNVAVEKLSDQRPGDDGYSAEIKIGSNNYTLKLTFNRVNQIYRFLVNPKIELRKEPDDFAAILDDLPICIWQKNKDLKITYCNKTYADVLETTKESVIQNNTKLFQQSKNSVYVDHSLYLNKAKKFKEHIIINGERKLVDIEESPFLGKEKSTGIAIDITDKENLEKNYKNYKKQIEDALDNLSVSLAVFDENSVLVFANQSMIQLFSIDKLDIYDNCKFSDIIDYILSNNSKLVSEDIIKHKDDIKNLFQTIIEPYHTTFQLANERIFNISVIPNPAGGLTFVFDDVSDRISLERDLNSLSVSQLEILNNLSEGILVFGTDSKIKIANKFVNKLFDIQEDYVSNDLHFADYFKLSKPLLKSIDDIESWNSNLLEVISKHEYSSNTLSLDQDKVIKYDYIPLSEGLNLIRFLDISNDINLDKVQREKDDLTANINKIKSDLISNISYEMRSPLTAIQGFAEVLSNQYFGELNEKQTEYCHGILDSVWKLGNVVDSIINLANLENGHLKIKYEETNLLDFVNDLIDVFKNQVTLSNALIKTDFSDNDFNVFIDKNLVKQLSIQLINKILQYNIKGEDIWISIEQQDNTPDYFYFIIKTLGMSLNDAEIERINKILLNDSMGDANNLIDFGLIFANKIIRLHNGKMAINFDQNTMLSVKCCIPIKQFWQ